MGITNSQQIWAVRLNTGEFLNHDLNKTTRLSDAIFNSPVAAQKALDSSNFVGTIMRGRIELLHPTFKGEGEVTNESTHKRRSV